MNNKRWTHEKMKYVCRRSEKECRRQEGNFSINGRWWITCGDQNFLANECSPHQVENSFQLFSIKFYILMEKIQSTSKKKVFPSCTFSSLNFCVTWKDFVSLSFSSLCLSTTITFPPFHRHCRNEFGLCGWV